MTMIETPRPPRGRWQQVNVWAGHLIFGFPAVAAIPALVATVARFGLLDSILSAGPAALTACLPVALWARYTSRRPGTYTGKVTWFVVAVVGLGTLAFSPPAGTDHQERPVTPTPRTHQLEAIAAIQAHLHTTDRVSVLMACGTGKTLVGRWLAEQRQASRTLVVVPSLALIAQTLSEWRSAAGWMFEALIICSDPSRARSGPGTAPRSPPPLTQLPMS